MNKTEIINAVAEDTGMTKAETAEVFEAIFDEITESLKQGDAVRIPNFGTFAVAKRKASMGRNPRTGEAISIAASNMPRFKAAKKLKQSVNE